MPGRISRKNAGRPSARPFRVQTILTVVLTVVGADLAVLAGWTQALWLRVLVLVLITAVGFLIQVRFGSWRAWVPHHLPPEVGLPFFCGRAKEIEKLLERHRKGRNDARPSNASDGPVILSIHGRPGIGKTALAQRLALRLAREYRGGQLYVEGRGREPREILLSLLDQLDWPEAEMLGRADAKALADVFRGKTAGKSMLIVLDGLRSRAQLDQVLPGTSTCTVITTSRANLHAGSLPSYRLGPLAAEEATEVILAACGEDAKGKVDLVAEAIDLCDRQPDALLSVGELALGEGLDRTVERLRNERDRLAMLRYRGRSVADGIASEYNNLEDTEKEAFLLLTLSESETFVPWTLQPLMKTKIGSVQAGNIMAKISRGGLLEPEGEDPSGFGRYRISSLIRLFADQRLREGDLITAAEASQALDRFRRAYLAGSIRVLEKKGITGLPVVPFAVPPDWYPQVPGWDEKVAEHIGFWARAEFGNVIRAVLEADHHKLPNACWQLALQAADCFAPPARHRDIRDAFEAALQAAQLSPKPRYAEIKVRLARSGYLIAVHDYSEAIAELTGVVDLSESEGDLPAKAEALRCLGWARQQLGDYDKASAALHSGEAVASQARRRESHLIELLLAENESMKNPARWTSQLPLDGLRNPREPAQFIEKIILCRSACRRREPLACDELLREARQHYSGNLAYCLDIEHERAAAMLHCGSGGSGGNGRQASPPSGPALRATALALRYADRLGRPYGQARGRCALAQALVRSGQTRECLEQLSRAEEIIYSLPDKEIQRLSVYLERVRGEALLARQRPGEAITALELAGRQLNQPESWAHAEILVLLGIARREVRDLVAALAAHATAVEIFRRHNDRVAAAHAFKELRTTMRAAHFHIYRPSRIQHAPMGE